MADEKTAEQSSSPEPTLDDLVKSYEKVAPQQSEMAARVAALEGELTQNIIDTEIVPKIKGDLDVPDKIVRGFLDQSAAENPKLNEFFRNRKSSPKDFSEALDSVKEEFQQMMGKKTEELEKQDDKGLAAAAAAAREATPADSSFDNISWGSLSEHEFEARKAEVFKALRDGKITEFQE